MANSQTVRLQILSGTNDMLAGGELSDLILLRGEPILNTTTGALAFGDGVHTYKELTKINPMPRNDTGSYKVVVLRPNSNEQFTFTLSNGIEASTVVQRTENGRIRAAAPVGGSDVTTKEYVDNNFLKTQHGEFIYGINSISSSSSSQQYITIQPHSITITDQGSRSYTRYNNQTVTIGDIDNNFTTIYFPNENGTLATRDWVLSNSSSGLNIKNGSGTSGIQQAQDQKDGITSGYFSFSDSNGQSKNPNAYELDNTLIGEIKYGATGAYSSAFGGQCAAIGKRSFACGTTTIAQSDYSHTEGNSTVTLGYNAHAEGLQTTAAGEHSHAEGHLSLAKGAVSHAEGYGTKATGDHSHAEGHETEASGGHSHAEGYQTKASNSVAHAEGHSTQALGEHSHAEGFESVAKGNNTHAEGYQTLAQGNASHAQGIGTQALGGSSSASGYMTKASRDNQTVVGQFNLVRSSTLFEVGIGGSETSRKNGLEVYSTGDIGIRYQDNVYSLQGILSKLLTKAGLNIADIPKLY